MRTITLDHSTTPGLDPLETLALAQELGCDGVVLRMQTYPGVTRRSYDIVHDSALQRAIRADAAARGLFIAMGSPFEIRPGVPVAELQPALEAAAAIGARGLNVVVYDPDRATHVERIGELAEAAGRLGLRTLLEFFALSGLNSLPYTLEVIAKVGHRMLGINADILHITRTGARMAELAAVDPALVGHAQIDDGPAELSVEQQMAEARGERLLPGEGSFDVLGFVRALPADCPIGIEAPSTSRAAAGETHEARARAAVAATRRVITAALRPA